MLERLSKATKDNGSALRVVLFSGGRGSEVLSQQLIVNDRIDLTLAINGYDDGKSTGEVRRFIGDCLGPSDFRKNAARMVSAMNTCPKGLIALLDQRLADDCSKEAGLSILALLGSGQDEIITPNSELEKQTVLSLSELPAGTREEVAKRFRAFSDELQLNQRNFSFSDCSLGNLAFAGGYLINNREFNSAVADYCNLLGLPEGLVENVTDGQNAFLVAIDRQNRLLSCEAEIVDASEHSSIREIYLIDEWLGRDQASELGRLSPEELEGFLDDHKITPQPNARLLDKIALADVIIYAPGTQHSSLLPSYMTRGLGEAVAGNLHAIKLLVTNIQEDSEILDTSAIELVAKAVYYLRDKDRLDIPSPCLITHCLINDPTGTHTDAPYVPLGSLNSVEDPRLIRIANYEEGISGRHNATKVLTPFIETLVARDARRRVAVLLVGTESRDKLTQTLLEALRGGLGDLTVEVEVFYASPNPIPDDFAAKLPCGLRNVWRSDASTEQLLLGTVREQACDYVALFESSGMYRGEDLVHLLSLLSVGELDAVWGSRRLSVRDIRESYKLRYRRNPILGAVSYVGSHMLSLIYLVLYGRYVSDTLSGARALRARFFDSPDVDLADKKLNQRLLSGVLENNGDLFETPVRFFSMSPIQVKRTTVREGLGSILSILIWRFRRVRHSSAKAADGVAVNDSRTDSVRR